MAQVFWAMVILAGGALAGFTWWLWHIIKPSHIFTITGVVRVGNGWGEKIGARTANLDVALAKNMPAGLYSCEVILGNESYGGLLYYGYNSLAKRVCLEVHIINYSQDIYGKLITVVTNKFLRKVKIFASEDELKKQIATDLAAAK